MMTAVSSGGNLTWARTQDCELYASRMPTTFPCWTVLVLFSVEEGLRLDEWIHISAYGTAEAKMEPSFQLHHGNAPCIALIHTATPYHSLLRKHHIGDTVRA